MKANSFLLSLCSPVLQTMICGSFTEGAGRQMVVQDVDGAAFVKVLDLWCGKENQEVQNVSELLSMGTVADRFQMTEVVSSIVEAVIGQLSVEVCCDVLSWGGRAWLERGEAAARELAVERFEEVAATGGFMRMSEEMVWSLLEQDRLGVGTEEAAFEAAVTWMKGGDGDLLRGRGLLRAIRFPHMGWEYLGSRVREALHGGLDGEWVGAVVEEAMRAKAALRDGVEMDVRLLGPKAMMRRVEREVRWEHYRNNADGGRRLQGHTHTVMAVAVWEGRVCSGSIDGTVRVWNRATLEEERVLLAEGDRFQVLSLAVWGGRVINGHSNRLLVWSLHSGECEQVLQGHSGIVSALAVHGSRLVSGSDDGSIRVWTMGAAAPWACERTLTGHMGCIQCLATWRDKFVSGSDDTTVCIWDAGTGAHDATLTGHGNTVCGLAVAGDRLFSASADGTIRAWAAGTWAAVRTVRVYGQDIGEFPRCLAVSGGKLVMGSRGGEHSEVRIRVPILCNFFVFFFNLEFFSFSKAAFRSWSDASPQVRVFDLETLECEHALRQPGGVLALAAEEGEVWGGVLREVVVWGRE